MGTRRQGESGRPLGSAGFAFARAITREILTVYAIKMAVVFMIATATFACRTEFVSRGISMLNYTSAALLPFKGRSRYRKETT